MLFGFLFVTVSSRLTGEIGSSSNPISGMTVATLLFTCLYFPGTSAIREGTCRLRIDLRRTVGSGRRLHRCIQWRHDFARLEDWLLGRRDAAIPTTGDRHRTLTSALVIGVILVVLNSASTVYSTRQLPSLRQPLDVSKLPDIEQPRNVEDTKLYHVWHAIEGNSEGVPPGKIPRR